MSQVVSLKIYNALRASSLSFRIQGLIGETCSNFIFGFKKEPTNTEKEREIVGAGFIWPDLLPSVPERTTCELGCE